MIDELMASSTILTPNRRLAATLQKRYQQQQSQLKACWMTPDILPMASWIQRLWLENSYESATPFLLNSAQEQFVWETTLRESKASAPLLQVSETADLVKSAHGLLKQWRVDINLPDFNRTEDYIALKYWINTFEKKCLENNWVDSASMVDLLIHRLSFDVPDRVQHAESRNIIKLPPSISLVGFTEISPQMKKLLDACRKRGVNVQQPLSHSLLSRKRGAIHPVTLSSRNKSDTGMDLHLRGDDIHHFTAENDDSEILLMARWAKSIFDSNEEAIIGCVIPNLEKARDRAIQLFTDVFGETTNAFNVSAGKRLNEFPIIHAALQLLNINKKPLSRESLSYLLTSPFLGSAENERIKRAFVDRAFRQSNTSKIKLESNEQLLSYCPKFIKLFTCYIQLMDQYDNSSSYAEWAQRISALLTAWGWPGERSLNSEEYQTIDAWYTALNEFTSLDYVAKPVNYYDALQALKRIISNNIFQPKTPDARVQVLGVLEAAGSPFDYLWIAGMDDLAWPPQPKPHPFIPKQLQRELNMPHATAERELMFCTTVTQQFKDNADVIIFSHAKENDELERQVSPLLRDLPEINVNDLFFEDYQTPYQRVYASKRTHTLTDYQAPALKQGEKAHGGIGIIKKQAMCAFKAFAEHRLHAHELENPLLGLRKKDRGELIHKVMETIWNKLENHAALVSIDDMTLQAHIHESIETAFQAIPTSHTDYPNYIALEKKRLEKLVWQWLQIEKTRPPFKIVNNEKKSTITLNQLTLTIRIDRVDELMDGKKLIIDYKTGKDNSAKSWLGERPDEPQLPVYALLEPENTFAIAFAQLYPGKYLFSGLSQHDADIKGIKPLLTWNQQLDEWRHVLNKLSDDFYQGVAVVDPKDQEKTCEWCALQPLCRIKEEAHKARNDGATNEY